MKNEVIPDLRQMKDTKRRYAIVRLLPLIYPPAKQTACGKRNMMEGKETGSRPWLVEGLFALPFSCQ